MKQVANGPISLMTESFGAPEDPALVLVMGATASMLSWPDALCRRLAAGGFRVIRFDHRDTGQSTTGPAGEPGYTIEDMVGDLFAVLDGYDLPAAHVVGMSLGGLIGQMAALTQPERVRSLTLIASEPLGWDGEPLSHISDAVMAHFQEAATLDWSDRAAVAGFLLEVSLLCSGSRYGFDARGERAVIERVLDRTDNIAAAFNHSRLALDGDWTGRFRDIRQPVLVIHGAEDPVLPLVNGRALAEGIAGARFTVLHGVGHELPPPELPVLAAEMLAFLRTV